MTTRTTSIGVALTALFIGCRNDIGLDNEVNVPPAARITAPETGEVYETGAVVRFEGVVSDGNRIRDISRVWWTSDIDGELGQEELVALDDLGNTRFETALSDGLHTITLAATDGAGESAFDTISVEVIGGPQFPEAEFIQPTEFEPFLLGEDIDIVALVSDPQDRNEELWVTVSWEQAESSGVPTFLYEDLASSNGSIRVTFEQPTVGAYSLVLTAEDTDGNITDTAITVFVGDPNDEDNDGDGFSNNAGDCDDTDATAYPGADETCGDGDDNDCDGIVDNKDLDADGHVDENCLAYTGPLPVDDCDDTNGTVLPDAPERLNGIDDDCDGYIDEGTVVFDDDSDCFCEEGPCTGSFTTCSTVADGDCDDTNNSIFPGAPDNPDTDYLDDNCDGIDGVVTEGVFVAPNGNDSGDCPLEAPCATLGYAVGRSAATNRPFVNVRAGTYPGSFAVSSDVTLVGGFDSNWERSVRGGAGHEVEIVGSTLDGEYMAIRVRGADFRAMDLEITGASVPSSGIGKSSYVIHAAQSSNITLERVGIQQGDGGPGAVGSSGNEGPEPSGRNGRSGGNGENHGTFDTCRDSEAPGGLGGTNASCSGATAGGRGGHGGRGDERCCLGGSACAACSLWNNDACDAQGGGSGGNAAVTNSTNGRGGAAGAGDDSGSCTISVGTGRDGAPGLVGTDGAGGNGAAPNGSLTSGLWWRANNGSTGWTGTHGGGGGGGGGAGACDDGFFGGDFGGNAGGGGGAGGCRATTAGSGGSGGGGSFGVFLVGGSISALQSRFTLGNGGRGGNGGDGGTGGSGGSGGIGGQSTGFEAGRGGNGGRGGHSGGGGGGGGGHSIGIYGVNAGTIVTTGTTSSQGSAGAGGAGGRSAANTSATNGEAGAPGLVGLVAEHGL